MSAELAGLPRSGHLGAPAARIHPSALVAKGAVLGRGVEIGPWCSVGQDVTLGDGVRLVHHPGGAPVKLERISLTLAPLATNLWFRVVR